MKSTKTVTDTFIDAQLEVMASGNGKLKALATLTQAQPDANPVHRILAAWKLVATGNAATSKELGETGTPFYFGIFLKNLMNGSTRIAVRYGYAVSRVESLPDVSAMDFEHSDGVEVDAFCADAQFEDNTAEMLEQIADDHDLPVMDMARIEHVIGVDHRNLNKIWLLATAHEYSHTGSLAMYSWDSKEGKRWVNLGSSNDLAECAAIIERENVERREHQEQSDRTANLIAIREFEATFEEA